ncbi:MAG: hypothetical protein COA78_10540 [Blastopirellula sp.]|nr:MAG: hypothetical protein COA78_10540 [Blastopirellula sp.]
MNDDNPTPAEQNPFSSPEVDTTTVTITDNKSAPSGVVLAVAVVNLVFGVLGLLCTGFSVLGFLMISYQISSGNMPAPQAAAFQGSNFVMMIIGTVCVYFLPSVGFIMTGFGLIYRKQWGRILAFVMGGVMTLLGLYCVGAGVWRMSMMGDITNFGPESIGVFFSIIFGLFALLYPVMTYSILLRKKYAAEFIAQPQSTSKD